MVGDFAQLMEEQMRDPAFRAAYEDAKAREWLMRLLVDERQIRGLTLEQVAVRMKLAVHKVQNFELGGTDPPLSLPQRYARAIGLGVNIWVTETGGIGRHRQI